jgi:hypothetical protein
MAKPVATPVLAGFVPYDTPICDTQSEHPLDMRTPTTIVSTKTQKCESTKPLSWLDGEPIDDTTLTHHIYDEHTCKYDINVAKIIKSYKWSTFV